MANSPKFTSFHHVTNAPTGHGLPHAMTLPALSPKNHKHYHSHSQSQSHSHDHVSTPYPVLEHSSTSSSIGSDSSTGSTDYMQSHKHHHHVHRHSIPNPIHAVQDHVSEFRYGQMARSAKQEARKSSSSHPWSLEASLAKGHESIDEQYEEVIEDWRERDEKAWAAELSKREKARRSYGSVSTDKTVEEEK